MLTQGRTDPGHHSVRPARPTSVSYTYRIASRTPGQQFGLGAILPVIFAIVAILSAATAAPHKVGRGKR